MHTSVYNTQRWRALPRTECIVEHLLGDAGGPCSGLIHRHHINPNDPGSRTVSCCAAHHGNLHGLLRHFGRPERRRCPHRHTTREAREQCERRLNRSVAA